MTNIVFILYSLYTEGMRIVTLLSILLALQIPAYAGNRADHWSGFDFCTGTPFPALAGAMLGFNVNDDARISTGVGVFGPWVTYQLDAKVFLADAPWAIYVGAGLDYMNGKHANFLAWHFQFDRAFVPYMEGGIDFQSDIGVHVAFNLAGSAPNGQAIVLPGIAIGWYF